MMLMLQEVTSKHGERIEMISLQEEFEQSLIDLSVAVNFTCHPMKKLVPNRDCALKVYRQQTKKLSRDPVAKEAVLNSEHKLQTGGHVEYVSNWSSRDNGQV